MSGLKRGCAGRARPLFYRWRLQAPALRLGLLIIILGLAASLRLINLPGNPGWYTDEGAHLDAAWHLSQGRFQFLAITQSILFAARPPLFELLLAAGLNAPGEGIAILRTLTGSLGVVSAGLLALLVWAGQEPRSPGRASVPAVERLAGFDGLALLAAGLYAVYQPAVVYSRFGFSYNLITVLLLVTGIGLVKYWDTRRLRWLMLAALAVGAGTVSDLWMGMVTVPVLLGALEWRWPQVLGSLRRAALAGLIMLVPFGLYAGLMLVTAPQAFLFDLRYTLGRLNTIPLGSQPGVLADNLLVLGAGTPWIAAALAGLLMLPPRLRLASALLFAWPFFVLGRATALYSLSFYYLVPLLPFIPLGIAALVWRAARWLVGRLARLGRGAERLAAILLVAVAAGGVIGLWGEAYAQVWSGFVTPIDDFLLNPDQARAADAYVNAHVRPTDLVIASPGLAWLICGRGAAAGCRVADSEMAVAATGQATPHLPANLPPDRWAFDPRFSQARFVVVDNLWRNWAAVHMPQVDALLQGAGDHWREAFVAGDITVYYVSDQ